MAEFPEMAQTIPRQRVDRLNDEPRRMETSIFDPGETGTGWCCRILDVQLEATGKNTATEGFATRWVAH
jgi:hypothetical protein